MYIQEKIRPYNNIDAKEKQVETMFDSIAHSYDVLNHFLSLGIDKHWRTKTIKTLKPFQPKKVLDVATGTGDFAILACKLLHPEKIVGCDISDGMMSIAKQKVEKEGFSGIISFQKENCENLSFNDNSFDTITVAYGVRNFSHLDIGLKEMFRVLQSGGHLAILELCTPNKFPMKQIFWLYSHVWMPLVGKLISQDDKAYKYLPATMEVFPQGEIMQEIIRKAGFKNVYFKRFTFGLSTMYIATK